MKESEKLIYQFECRTELDLVVLLRLLMPTEGGVLARTWEFRGLIAGVCSDGSISRNGLKIWLFPELADRNPGEPFTLDGVHLVERSALAAHFEDTLLVRLSELDETKTDLELLFDCGQFRLETDDQEAYELLFDYVDKNDFW